MESSTLFAWILAGVSAVIATLASAVGWQNKKQVELYESLITDLKLRVDKVEKSSEDCEKDRVELYREVGKMSGELNSVKGRLSEVEENKANRKTLERKIDELKQ